MPCDCCGHTMQNVGAEHRRIFWCPRCGTLLYDNGDFRQQSVPELARAVASAEAARVVALSAGLGPLYVTFVNADYWRQVTDCIGLKREPIGG